MFKPPPVKRAAAAACVLPNTECEGVPSSCLNAEIINVEQTINLYEIRQAGKNIFKEGDNMKKRWLILSGAVVGFINALFGAGGGMIVVPILTKVGLSQKESQATAVSIILPLTAATCIIYYFQGTLNISEAFKFIPLGLVGAVVGSLLLKKAPDNILKKCFAVFMLWAGGRMIFK